FLGPRAHENRDQATVALVTARFPVDLIRLVALPLEFLLDRPRPRPGRRIVERDRVPDWVIRAQFGHVSPAMMGVYSHVRRKALDEAAQALEPDATSPVLPVPEPPATDG